MYSNRENTDQGIQKCLFVTEIVESSRNVSDGINNTAPLLCPICTHLTPKLHCKIL